MIQFCKKILFLLIGSISIFLVLLGLTNKCLLNQELSYTLDPSIHTLFLGHSHTECGYNDSIIPQSINLAQSGESYFYTYLKLKSILRANNQIDQVFVEFTNNQITKEKDEWTWDKMHISRSFPSLSPICSIEDHYNILINSPINYINGLQKTFANNIKRFTLKSFFFQIKNSGGFTKSDKVLDENIAKRPKYVDLEEYSEINMHYLEKITQLCVNYNVHLNLIRSPLYVSSNHMVNEKLFQEIREMRFNDIKFIDLKDLINNPTYFRDYGHLNTMGASVLSGYISNNL